MQDANANCEGLNNKRVITVLLSLLLLLLGESKPDWNSYGLQRGYLHKEVQAVLLSGRFFFFLNILRLLCPHKSSVSSL